MDMEPSGMSFHVNWEEEEEGTSRIVNFAEHVATTLGRF